MVKMLPVRVTDDGLTVWPGRSRIVRRARFSRFLLFMVRALATYHGRRTHRLDRMLVNFPSPTLFPLPLASYGGHHFC